MSNPNTKHTVSEPHTADKPFESIKNDQKRLPMGKLRSQGLASKLMADHYIELNNASKSQDRKIAWCSSVGPAELLRGMGFLVYFPENHAAMLGAYRKISEVSSLAAREGFSSDICSYLRGDIGAFLADTTPLSNIDSSIVAPPRPDVLVYNTNQCRDIKDWFSWYAAKHNALCIGIDSPRALDNIEQEHINYVSKQIRSLIPTLENITQQKSDMDEICRATFLSKECSRLWEQALDKARHCPSPLSFYLSLTLMGPAVVARGTEKAVAFMKFLNEELDEQIANNVYAIKKETHRLYWDGMPIWGKLSALHKLFSDLDANIVASTYCNSWVFEALNEQNPIESMARAYLELFITRSDKIKEQYLISMADRFNICGVVFHEAKTCPNNSNSRYGLTHSLSRKRGLPVTTIFSDHADSNLFDSERIAIQLEAFIEALK